MASASDFPGGSIRLADQIERLSELMETITYRMLELEERLVLQEERLAAQDLSGGDTGEAAAALERRLEESAERLLRIETMLSSFERGAAGPGRATGRLQVLSSAAAEDSHDWPDPDPQEGSQDPDPFFDEGEQPFMDERIA
jgi:hypothetical protein